MKKKILLTASILIISCSGILGQATTISEKQRALKKLLLKHAPNVYRVNFDQCKMDVRLSSGYSFGSSSRGGGAVAAGSWPQDAYASAFSGGADDSFRDTFKIDTYTVDLAALGNGATSLSVTRYGPTRTMIVVNNSVTKRESKALVPSRLVFRIKESVAVVVVKSFDELAVACGGTN